MHPASRPTSPGSVSRPSGRPSAIRSPPPTWHASCFSSQRRRVLHETEPHRFPTDGVPPRAGMPCPVSCVGRSPAAPPGCRRSRIEARSARARSDVMSFRLIEALRRGCRGVIPAAAALLAISFPTFSAGSCACLPAHGHCNGWCDSCGIGYVDSHRTSCRSCYEHLLSPRGGWCSRCGTGCARGLETRCRSCFSAIRRDGHCQECDLWFANGRVTSCTHCHSLMRSEAGGWCSKCKVGHARGFVTGCSSCLKAIQANGRCDACGVYYILGQPTKCKECRSAAEANASCAHCGTCWWKGRKVECHDCHRAKCARGSEAECRACASRPLPCGHHCGASHRRGCGHGHHKGGHGCR